MSLQRVRQQAKELARGKATVEAQAKSFIYVEKGEKGDNKKTNSPNYATEDEA